MKRTMFIMSLAVVGLAISAWYQGGMDLLGTGVMAGILMFIDVLPMLIAAFAVSGLVQVLINPQMINNFLGEGKGLKGVTLGAVAGSVIPGGPYVYYPLSASFATAGVQASTLMAFVVSKSLWDLARIPMEVAIIGFTPAMIRLLVTLPFPILAGLLVYWFYPGLTRQMLPVQKMEEDKQ
ncbi:permease [Dethiobacter alkaliphilus]|uniref:Permease n=1 Tax=Dethiobacter alkaliphilus AHT 1 TaxID=555088 RepID=C0GCX1_DETAL|nr:permease [Dethiobacter alkaliphilus]EEG79056.1 conserved hypothetical protein [Dethiobacter alkaliphilus AHT 1]MCW3490522.1 permease [Dethiobacter alkaliphilus]